MTRSEYLQRARQHSRRTRVPGNFVLVSWFVVAIAGSHLAQEQPLVFFPAILAYFVLSLLVLSFLSRLSINKLGLACPDCGKSLMGRKERPSQVVVTTGRCGSCGELVIHGDAS